MPIKLSTPLSTVKFKECFLLFSPKISRFSGDWSKSDIAIDKPSASQASTNVPFCPSRTTYEIPPTLEATTGSP